MFTQLSSIGSSPLRFTLCIFATHLSLDESAELLEQRRIKVAWNPKIWGFQEKNKFKPSSSTKDHNFEFYYF